MATSKTSGKAKTKTESRRTAKPQATSLASDMQTAPPMAVSRDAVADLAYQLFLQRGAQHGYDLDDWVTAERQLGAVAG